jgi:hypothetical protein
VATRTGLFLPTATQQCQLHILAQNSILARLAGEVFRFAAIVTRIE